MQCREVKRRLNEKLALDEKLNEHVKNCPGCIKEIQLAEKLDRVFQAEKKSTGYGTSSFDEIKARIIARSAPGPCKEISFMAKLKTEIENHPGFSAGIAFTAIVTAVLLLIPVSFNKTVGYDLSFKGFQTAAVIPQDRMMSLLDAFGYGDASIDVKETENGYDCKIANLPDRQAAMAVEAAMIELTGVEKRAVIKPIVERISGNLYAQVKERVKIETKSENRSNQEIRDEIRRKLKELGYDAGEVNVSVDKNGVRQITLFPNDSTGENAFDKNIWLDIDENGNVDIGLIDQHPGAIIIDPKGKTADQIKQEIIDKLKAKGQDNPEVEVIKFEDGQTKIKIKQPKDD